MGLTPLMLFIASLLIVRNQRILAAWDARQEENQRRAANGLPPKTRSAAAKPSPAHRRPAIARARHPSPARSPQCRQHKHARKHAPRTESNQPGTHRTRPAPHTETTGAPGMSDQNVKIGLTET